MELNFKEGEMVILNPHVEAKPEHYMIVNLLTTQ